ncbi:alpha/beta fold hydrolase [Nocardioides halotolerans]|uniref:alpha/beta fold hydrolase n=1 Tax=Nocardioides halotolerans TaxID=433660 RepID=UPI0003FD29B5|nr:alpha/beta fold hydrolase [Nocardioides halotolerans]
MIEINEEFTVAAPPDEVYAVLSDPHAVVECVQGAELGETHEDGTFDSSITIKFSALKIKFLGRVGLDLDEPDRRGTMTASGKDGQGGTKFNVTAEFTVQPGQETGTSFVTTKGEVELRGKLAGMIEGAATAVTKRMAGEFIEALSLRCASGSTQFSAAPAAGTTDSGGEVAAPAGPASAAVLVHDFGGSPNTLRAWGEALAAKGVAVSIPRLPGHGTRWKDLNATTFDQWYDATRAAVADARREHPTVVVMGLGLGGTLALRVAAESGEVAGVVAVNPVVTGLANVTGWDLAWRWLRRSKPAVADDIKKAGVVDTAYDRTALKAAKELRRGAAATLAVLGQVRCPATVVVSGTDHVVPTRDGATVAEALGERARPVSAASSFHVVPLDHDAELLVAESLALVRSADPVDVGSSTTGA